MTYPEPIEKLIEQLRRLPGVGPKTAERYVFHLLRRPPEETTALIQELAHVRDAIDRCAICGTFTETSPCVICRNPRRDHAVLCVVAEASDIIAIERTGEFRGVYHVLGGLLTPIEGIGPEQLRITELIHRVRGSYEGEPQAREIDEMRSRAASSRERRTWGTSLSSAASDEPEGSAAREASSAESQGVPTDRDFPHLREVIFAFDPTIEGETTVNYLARLLTPTGIRCTRIARGLPVGGDLEYADPITLADAFTGRRELPNIATQHVTRALHTADAPPPF